MLHKPHNAEVLLQTSGEVLLPTELASPLGAKGL
jgi:hypothetical protein